MRNSKPVRWVFVGAVNTLFGLLVIYGCKWAFGVPDVRANSIGYAFGFALSFSLNRRWTFGYKGDALGALLRFSLVTGVAYLVQLSAVLALLGLGVSSYISQAIGIVPYTAVGYLGSRYFAFALGRGEGAPPCNAASSPTVLLGPDVQTAHMTSKSPSHARGAGRAPRATPDV